MTIESQISEPNVDPDSGTPQDDAALFASVFSGDDYLSPEDNPSDIDMNQVLDGLVEIGEDDAEPAEPKAAEEKKAEPVDVKEDTDEDDEGEEKPKEEDEKEAKEEPKESEEDKQAKAKADADARRRMKAVEHREREFLSKAAEQKQALAEQIAQLDEKQAKLEEYIEKAKSARVDTDRLKTVDPLRYIEQELGVSVEALVAMQMERDGHDVPASLRGELNKFRSDPKRQERGLTREDIAEEVAKLLDSRDQRRSQEAQEHQAKTAQQQEQEIYNQNVELAIGVVRHFADEYPLIRGLIKTPESLMSHMMAARRAIYEEHGHDGSPKECADYIENMLGEGVRAGGYHRPATPTGEESGKQPPQGKRTEASTLTNRTASDRITRTNHDDMDAVYDAEWTALGVG